MRDETAFQSRSRLEFLVAGAKHDESGICGQNVLNDVKVNEGIA